MANQPVNLNLLISEEGADEGRLDQLTQSLMRDLRDFDLESLERPQGGPAPEGARGDPFTIGALALAVLPSVLPPLINFLQTRTGADRKIEIEAPNGFKVAFTPNSQYTQEEILELARRIIELSSTNDL